MTQGPVNYQTKHESIHVSTHLLKMKVTSLPSTAVSPLISETFFTIISDKRIDVKVNHIGVLQFYSTSSLLFQINSNRFIKGQWSFIKITLASGLKEFYECSLSIQIFFSYFVYPSQEEGFSYKCKR